MGNNLSALTYYSNNYYLKVGNLSPIPAILEPITSIPYDVRLLKPSTLYTIKYNRGGNSNSMSFDLGGSVVEKTNSITDLTGIAEELTVRTPTILSHEQLILSGTGFAYNLIVAEGDITGTELPYFKGMKNVKMPIVKNIGKNLFHGGFELGTMVGATGEYVYVTTAIRATDYTKVMGGKQYVFYCDDLQYKFAYVQYDKDKKFLRASSGYLSGEVVRLQNDVAYVIMRTPNNATPIMNNPHVRLAVYEYEEGMDTTLQDYKENSVYAVQGEIPFSEDMFGQGSIGNYSSNVGQNFMVNTELGARICLKSLLRVKKGSTYMIRTNSDFKVQTYSYTIDDKVSAIPYATTWGQQAIFIAQDDKILVTLAYKSDKAITPSAFSSSGLQLFELDSTINLRSLPNGVKDELNLLTGEYIQRVGEVVVDGGGDYTEHIHSSSTYYGFRVPVTLKPKIRQYESYPRPIICDKLPSINYGSYFNGLAEGVSMFEGESTTVTNIYVSFDRNRINMPQEENSIDHVKEYCKTNPLTLQYELAEPIISHVRLVSNNQEREVGVKLPNGVCNTYNPSTGMTTVRVGTMVLDGSENWEKDELQFYTLKNEYASSVKAVNSGGVVIPNTQNFNILTGSYYQFLILHDKLPSSDITTVNQWKEYLSQNPTQVWYELQYPQIQPDIVLPNGVHDEYNPETGVYTKKVGFVELDGSADEKLDSIINNYNKENTIVFFANQHTPLAKKYENKSKGYPIYTNQFEYVDVDLGQQSGGATSMDVEGAYMAFDGNPCFAISKEKLEPFGFTSDMNIKTQVVPIASKYLSQNPLKVWYELETPITYQLTPYFGLPQPYAYEDGYLIHDSAYPETTLPPEFKYKLIANRTGQVMQNNRKLQEHTTRLSNLEALIIEATIESLFNRELQLFELELMDVQLIDLGE